MDIFRIQKKLTPAIRKGDTQAVIDQVSKELQKLPKGPFHAVLNLAFANKPKSVASHFDKFITAEGKRFDVKAVYTETNGFDINPDCWYFDVFAFSQYGGHKDHDWLGDWESDEFPELTLKGMESLQSVYASDAFKDKSQKDACELCSLLVVAKFQDLIRQSVPLMRKLKAPLLATGHDYDFIAEFQSDT